MIYKSVIFYVVCAKINVLIYCAHPERDTGFKAYSKQYTVDRVEDENSAYRFLCLVAGLCVAPVLSQNSKFRRVFEWSQLEFDYPSPVERQLDIDTGAFIPGKPAPIDVDVYYSPRRKQNKIFVTIPRFQYGVPATLGTIHLPKSNHTPLIKPFPSWSWHTNPEECKHDRIVSVYRVQVDDCGRLWVLDTGRLPEGQACPPQILAFDLQTDQLIHRYEIPSSQLESRSILVTPVVDIRDPSCRDTFIYIADCQTYSIIVCDINNGVSWQITDKTMYPYPNYGTFRIQGEHFDLMDGILGMALGPYIPGQDRKLFYHAMSSPTENWVYTSYLRNQSMFMHDVSAPEIFHVYEGTRPSQSAAEAIDKNGIAFFGLMSETTINCWNTATDYGQRNIDLVEYNPKTLQFASGVKMVNNPNGVQELWILTSRFQKIGAGTLNPAETNFRIQAVKVEDALRGTKCKSRLSLTISQRHGSGRYSTKSVYTNTGGYGLVSTPPSDKLYFTNK